MDSREGTAGAAVGAAEGAADAAGARAAEGRAAGAAEGRAAGAAEGSSAGAAEGRAAGAAEAGGAPRDELAMGVAAGIERLLSLLRWLTPPDGLSFTAAATLATLERAGPCRLTLLAVQEGVTQPAMTQLAVRLEEAGLVTRSADPSDRRVVEVRITAEGSALLARRRRARAEQLTGMLARLSPGDQAALAAALPAMDALTSQRDRTSTSPHGTERSNA